MSTNLEIKDYDQAGCLSGTCIVSKTSQGHRVDQTLPAPTRSLGAQILDIFLPTGFPSSVTDDYVEYQIYDSLQAFASTIASLLSSRAVLEGVGVGDASASPTAALLLSILQESTGRVATILFAHRLGTTLEPECKMYRLAADIFNDAAMVLDCLSPAFPKVARVMILSTSSVMRALCGVAAGSSKASLSAHFARSGNIGELNAKDSSQETVLSLVGMLAGSIVVSQIKSLTATWITLLGLLMLHLYLNYSAVKAVCMTTLNRQRANIVFAHLIETGKVLEPREVSRRERIFERDGVMRWSGSILGYGVIGVGPSEVFSRVARRSGPRALSEIDLDINTWCEVFETCGYLLWYDAKTRTALALLKKGASTSDQLEAWMHGLLVAKRTQDLSASSSKVDTVDWLRSTREQVQGVFKNHTAALKAAGWDLEASVLETRSGMRVEVSAASWGRRES